MSRVLAPRPPLAAGRSIGERIRSARKALRMSQSDLAARLGVSQPAIANWETGVHDPRPLMLAKIAEALNAPLGWLSGGARSPIEEDTHPAAAYLRRPVKHVPVIGMEHAVRLWRDDRADPHDFAEDYIPVTAGSGRLFGVFITDEAMNLAFPRDTLVVIDAGDRAPADGGFYLVASDETPRLRVWRSAPARLEPYSSDPAHETIYLDDAAGVIGAARVSIRFH